MSDDGHPDGSAAVSGARPEGNAAGRAPTAELAELDATPKQAAVKAFTNPRFRYLRERLGRTIMVLRAPRVRIEMYGGDEALSVFRSFTARHPRFRVTAAKRWGVALLPLPSTHAEYLRPSRLARRKNINKALAAGFRYCVLSPIEHVDEIVEINSSAPARQGRPMSPHYLDRERIAGTIGARESMHAVVDSNGRVRAYAVVLDIGDAFALSSLIGHADDLDRGIMYLLVSEMVRWCIDSRHPDGSPMWLMADTFWGAKPGLAYFKERAGFKPYTVQWVWTERRS